MVCSRTTPTASPSRSSPRASRPTTRRPRHHDQHRWKFTNGEEITAESFTKAWNWAAQKSNAQGASYFFENIEGYSADKDSELTGLKVKGDDEFTVTLKSAQVGLPAVARLQTPSCRSPRCSTTTQGLRSEPDRQRPVQARRQERLDPQPDIKLVTNKDYQGKRKPKNGGLTITFYNSTQDTAYSDAQGGNLDVLDAVPDAAFSTYKSTSPNSNVNQAAAIFPGDLPALLPRPLEGRGGQAPSRGGVDVDQPQADHRQDLPGHAHPGQGLHLARHRRLVGRPRGFGRPEVRQAEAKKLWAQADEISPYNDTLTITYNADGGHEAWVTAVTNSISNTLGIKAEGNAVPTFAEALALQTDDKLKGGSRTGLAADYPSLYNFLGPTMVRVLGASNNYSRLRLGRVQRAARQGPFGVDRRRGQQVLRPGAGAPVQGPARDPALVLQT